MKVKFIRIILAIIVKYLLTERLSRYQRVFTVLCRTRLKRTAVHSNIINTLTFRINFDLFSSNLSDCQQGICFLYVCLFLPFSFLFQNFWLSFFSYRSFVDILYVSP